MTDDEYFKLSKELEKKHIIERIIFELEFIFIICLEEKVKLSEIYGVEGLNTFTKDEFYESLKTAIYYLQKKQNLNLKINDDTLYWVNIMGKVYI